MSGINPKLASLLSLATKAGMLRTGEETAESLLRQGTAQAVIVAADASDNTKKKFVNKCFYYKVPIRVTQSREILSKCVGKTNRTVYVVTDAGFSTKIVALIDDG